MAEKDLYKILGVAKDATTKEIKTAYRKLASRYHPDKNNGDKVAEKKFKELSAAYEVLANEEKRKQYDLYGPNWEAYANHGGAGEARYYGSRPHDERSSHQWQHVRWEGTGQQGEWEDILKNIFSGNSNPNTQGPFEGMHFDRQPQRGADLEANLEITLEEAYGGSRTRIDLKGQTIDVSIPPGAYEGQKLRLAGKGAPGINGGKKGDLYLNIRVADHPLFRQEGLDLLMDLPVTPAEAVTGAKVTVPTLKGGVSVKVPPGSNSGKVLRLKGMGMKNGQGQKGNLLIHLKIVLPESLSPKEKELYRELGNLNSQNVREKLFKNNGAHRAA